MFSHEDGAKKLGGGPKVQANVACYADRAKVSCQLYIPGKRRRRLFVGGPDIVGVICLKTYQENTFLSFGLNLVGENSWISSFTCKLSVSLFSSIGHTALGQ